MNRSGSRLSGIEILVSIALVGVGLVTLAGLFPRALERVPRGDLRARAALHAEAKLDELESLPWETLPEAAAADTVEALFHRSWRVGEDEPVAGLRHLEVRVRWMDDRGPRKLARSALRAPPWR